MKSLKGLSLLEVLLSLTIIAIIVIMATRYFSVTRSSQETNNAVRTVEVIRTAADRWKLSHDESYAGISIQNLIDRDMLPPNSDANAQGGKVSVESNDGDSKIKITFTDITTDECKILQTTFPPEDGPPPPGSCTPKKDNLTDYIGVFE